MKRYFEILCRWIPILIKYFLGFLSLNLFHRDLLEKDIWLITEKYGEARDNGYHIFKYIRTNHPDINAFFVITDDSPDRGKVACYGNVISQDSKEHMLYFLAAKYSVSSQLSTAHLYNLMTPELFRVVSKLTRKNQKRVFLQHGIIKDAMADKRFFYKNKMNDLFVTSTRREQEFVAREYGYPPGYIQELGLCRFDNLHHADVDDEKLVLVMPTWRSWLKTNKGTDEEKQTFYESEYCRTYVSLLKSEKLKNTLKKSGYKLIFYPHYGAQRYIDAFTQCNSECITVASKDNYDVQDLLIRSKVLITDFSSVYFDFAYMGKPVVYYQFDEEKFFAGHYQRGYFSYRDDGFGKVIDNENEVIDELNAILERGSVPEDKYAARRKDFFDLIDDKNCERNFNAILALDKKDR